MSLCQHLTNGWNYHEFDPIQFSEMELLALAVTGRKIPGIVSDDDYIKIIKHLVEAKVLTRVGDRQYEVVEAKWFSEQMSAMRKLDIHRPNFHHSCITELHGLIEQPTHAFLTHSTDRILYVDCHDQLLAMYYSPSAAARFLSDKCGIDADNDIVTGILAGRYDPSPLFRTMRTVSHREFKQQYPIKNLSINDTDEIKRQLDVLEWSY